jgi:hypothetical protein
MWPTYKYNDFSFFDFNKYYKYDLKFTVRCIPAFLKPLNDKIKVKLIKIKKIFKKQKRC